MVGDSRGLPLRPTVPIRTVDARKSQGSWMMVRRRSWLLLVSLSGLYSTVGLGRLVYRVAQEVIRMRHRATHANALLREHSLGAHSPRGTLEMPLRLSTCHVFHSTIRHLGRLTCLSMALNVPGTIDN